jgi:hypothetical protein
MIILTPLGLEAEPTATRKNCIFSTTTCLSRHVKRTVHGNLYICQSRKRLPEKLGLHCRLSGAIKEQMHEFQSLEQKH